MAETNPQQRPGMMQQPMDPLAQLRDIHQPGGIEDWPPAPGWWLLSVLAIAALSALLTKLFRHWRDNRYRREAVRELNTLLADWHSHQDDMAYLAALQELLKRVALTRFPRSNVANLSGEAWVQFLDHSSGSHDFSIGEMEILIDGTYRPEVEVNVEAMQSFALQWIREHDSQFLESRPA